MNLFYDSLYFEFEHISLKHVGLKATPDRTLAVNGLKFIPLTFIIHQVISISFQGSYCSLSKCLKSRYFYGFSLEKSTYQE